MKERVKFYSKNDWCYSIHLEKIETYIVPQFEDINVNDAIEFFQIKLYFDDGFCPKEWTNEQYNQFSKKQRDLFSLTMRFFNCLNDNNIVDEYEKVELDYKEAFWELFNKCKLYNKISPDVFADILHSKYVAPNHIFEKNNIVKEYGEILREYIKQNLYMVKILIDAYEQDFKEGNKLYLPDELTGDEICNCFDIYIQSAQADFYSLESIFQMKCTDRFPVTDELRLKAKRRYEEKVKEIRETGTNFDYSTRIALSSEQEEIKKLDFEGNIIIASYSTKWLMKTLEYSDILKNFIYLFEYVDKNQIDKINGAKLYRNKIVESTIPNRDKLTPYNLRHTYCTMLNDCGIGDYFKKRLMGHTLKDSITDSVYTHSSEEKIIRAAKPFLIYIQKLFNQALK